jgi:hypothetical protein
MKIRKRFMCTSIRSTLLQDGGLLVVDIATSHLILQLLYCFAAIHGGLVLVPAAHAVECMCCNCDGILNSRRSMECHRRHITSLGTPCADPSSYKSL